MTIDSAWVEVMKGEAPGAFTKKPPFVPRVCFLDGMPLLMASGAMTKWDDLVKWNFAYKVQNFFRMGAHTVILAFDDYHYVPLAKSITQANRAKTKVSIDFNERQTLETTMPKDYNSYLANRIYKRKVIDLVVETITEHVRIELPNKKLIIDYLGCPIVFEYSTRTRKWSHTYMTSMPPNGECDVKFTRWGRLYGDMICYSVDGDFLGIALMEHERQINELGVNGDPNKMAIYRLEYKMKEDKPAAAKKGDDNGKGRLKRDARGNLVLSNGERIPNEGGSTASAAPSRKRTFEYVDITSLYHVMRTAMHQCAPANVTGKVYEGHFMRILCFLIGLSGTDFSRKIPHLGAKKIWDMLPCKNIWPAIMRMYNPQTGQVCPGEACDMFIARLYLDKFCKHARGDTLEGVLASLQQSKLGDKIKNELPTVFRVDATVRNINWLLLYWECRQPVQVIKGVKEENVKVEVDGDTEMIGEPGDCETKEEEEVEWDYDVRYPVPVQDEYGFKFSAKKRRGGGMAVQWLDYDESGDT